MTKILILNWRCPKNPQAGGAEKVTLKHAAFWVKQGYDVSWLSGGYKNSQKEEVIDGVKIYRFGNPLTIYLLAPFIYWLKFKGRFDLVIDEIHGLPFLTPFWALKPKKIVFIHEVAQEIWDEMLSFPLNFLGKLYERFYFFIYKNIHFWTVSPSTKEDLIKFGIKKQSITVIPNGLDIQPIKIPTNKNKELTLIFISRLVRMKGIEETLEITAKIKKEIKTIKLHIVGTGKPSYVTYLQDLCQQLDISDNVTFEGFVSEAKKIDLLQKSHFLIHTSVREGFGLVVLEANSQGTPAIAYNNPGLRDVVVNGVNGYKFNPDNKEHLVNQIIKLFKNKSQYQKLAQSSIKYSKLFKWSKFTKQSTELIEEVLTK